MTFPNRTWPWRREDDGDAEAASARDRKPADLPASRLIAIADGHLDFATCAECASDSFAVVVKMDGGKLCITALVCTECDDHPKREVVDGVLR